jgi:hypothetical protein
MRRQFTAIACALLFVGGGALSADEAVLMDFSLLKADILPNASDQGKMTENKATMMDFSGTAGPNYTAEQKQQMHISLAITNWDVVLSSSSRTLMNQDLSKTAETAVSATGSQFAGKTVFGVRIHFPNEPFASWARITPPFKVPAFEPKSTVDDNGVITPAEAAQGVDPVNARLTRFEGVYDPATKVTTALGIVKNVGTIKSVAVNVRGLQFPNGLYAVLRDDNNDERTIFLGYLNFDGWKELRWDNPQYVTEVRNRELRLNPLYPNNVPYVRFDGFLITRDASSVGGDFIAYFKDVKILYDRAVLDPVRDVDDEAVWGIVTKRETDRKTLESVRFGEDQVQLYLDRLRQENKEKFTP